MIPGAAPGAPRRSATGQTESPYGAMQPALLPALDVPIQLHRGESRLHVGEAEIVVSDPAFRSAHPRQVRWRIDGGLMADELVLVFGRSLDWTGPKVRRAQGLLLIEDVFPQTFVLTRQQPEALSGLPRAILPEGVHAAGWSFGAVLVRGDDTPWVCSSLLRLMRDPA